MPDKPPSIMAEMLYAQQGVIVALLASRLNPNDFERCLAAARATMQIAAVSSGGSASQFDAVYDLYTAIFRQGDVNAERRGGEGG